MIVSGVPERFSNHAVEIIEVGLGMLAEISMLKNPSNGKPMMIRIGNMFKNFIRFEALQLAMIMITLHI
jgi:hypothetical protein